MKALKEMTCDEMITLVAGEALEFFVRGEKFRDVIARACILTLQWKSEAEPKRRPRSDAGKKRAEKPVTQ